jgi:type IV pilus assembly protein PilE
MHIERPTPPAAAPQRAAAQGFTLIELMITVAIIAILVAIALPSYRSYILRGQLVDGTNLLSAGRANMERYFQDNRTYADVLPLLSPCDAAVPVANRTQGNFVLTCSVTPTAIAYTLLATGSGPVNAVQYSVDQSGNQSTVSMGSTGWAIPALNTCWIMKSGQTC